MSIPELAGELARDYGRDVLAPDCFPILRNAMIRRGYEVSMDSMDYLEREIRKALGLPYAEPED